MQTTIHQAESDVEAKQAESFDPIGWLLFAHMDWCEAHSGWMFAAIGALIVLAGIVPGLLP